MKKLNETIKTEKKVLCKTKAKSTMLYKISLYHSEKNDNCPCPGNHAQNC